MRRALIVGAGCVALLAGCGRAGVNGPAAARPSLADYPARPPAHVQARICARYNDFRAGVRQDQPLAAAQALEELTAQPELCATDRMYLLIRLAGLYRAARTPDRALGLLEKLEERIPPEHPLYPELLFALAGAALDGGRTNQAMEVYTRLAQAHEDSEAGQRALLVLARHFRARTEYPPAAAYYEQYLGTYLGMHDHPDILAELAGMWLEAGARERAEETARQLLNELARYPDVGRMALRLARAFRAAGAWAPAQWCATQGARGRDEPAQQCALFLGGALTNDPEQALNWRLRALREYPLSKTTLAAYAQLTEAGAAFDLPALAVPPEKRTLWDQLCLLQARAAVRQARYAQALDLVYGLRFAGERDRVARAGILLDSFMGLARAAAQSGDRTAEQRWLAKALMARPLGAQSAAAFKRLLALGVAGHESLISAQALALARHPTRYAGELLGLWANYLARHRRPADALQLLDVALRAAAEPAGDLAWQRYNLLLDHGLTERAAAEGQRLLALQGLLPARADAIRLNLARRWLEQERAGDAVALLYLVSYTADNQKALRQMLAAHLDALRAVLTPERLEMLIGWAGFPATAETALRVRWVLADVRTDADAALRTAVAMARRGAGSGAGPDRFVQQLVDGFWTAGRQDLALQLVVELGADTGALGQARLKKLIAYARAAGRLDAAQHLLDLYLVDYSGAADELEQVRKLVEVQLARQDEKGAWAVIEEQLNAFTNTAEAVAFARRLSRTLGARASQLIEPLNSYILLTATAEADLYEAHHHLGRHYLQLRDYPRAVIHLEQAFGLAGAVSARQRVETGLELLEASVNAGRDARYVQYLLTGVTELINRIADPQLLASSGNRLGKALQSVGLDAQARQVFYDTANAGTNTIASRAALFNLAKSYTAAGLTNEAIAAYRLYLARYGNNATNRYDVWPHMAMANLLALAPGAGDPQLAAEMRQKSEAMLNGVRDPQLALDLAQYYGRQGHTNIEQALLDRALDDAVAGIDHAPDAATGHANLKNVIQRLYKMGHYAEAVQLGSQYDAIALGDDPSRQTEKLYEAEYERMRAMPWVTTTTATAQYGRQLLAKVRELQYPQAEAKILYYLTKAGKPDEREDCERQLVERFGASTYSLESKLRIAARSYRDGDVPKAVALTRDAMAQADDDYVKNYGAQHRYNAMYMMGTMLSAMGRVEEAAPLLEEVSRNFGTNGLYVQEIITNTGSQ